MDEDGGEWWRGAGSSSQSKSSIFFVFVCWSVAAAAALPLSSSLVAVTRSSTHLSLAIFVHSSCSPLHSPPPPPPPPPPAGGATQPADHSASQPASICFSALPWLSSSSAHSPTRTHIQHSSGVHDNQSSALALIRSLDDVRRVARWVSETQQTAKRRAGGCGRILSPPG